MKNLVKTTIDTISLSPEVELTVTESYNNKTGELYACVQEYKGDPERVMQYAVDKLQRKGICWKVIATEAEYNCLTVVLQMTEKERRDN